MGQLTQETLGWARHEHQGGHACNQLSSLIQTSLQLIFVKSFTGTSIMFTKANGWFYSGTLSIHLSVDWEIMQYIYGFMNSHFHWVKEHLGEIYSKPLCRTGILSSAKPGPFGHLTIGSSPVHAVSSPLYLWTYELLPVHPRASVRKGIWSKTGTLYVNSYEELFQITEPH